MHPGSYVERYDVAREAISSSPHLCVIPIVMCLGLTHLYTVLNEITQRKGEGLMLYNPSSKYISGRTSSILKVKAYQEEDVKFIKINPNSYSFVCEQRNGVECVVKCSGWDYAFPPSPGMLLKVKHNGFFESSQKMKYPFLWRRDKTELN
uniref:Uncharacterized protein n=1 Tax=Arcella intermedia TaxID=1963864 RepID=A0A6B2LMH4_9EUKA